MRFRNIERRESEQESASAQDHREEKSVRRKRAAPEMQEGATTHETSAGPALPLEWRKLGPFIEAERAVEPTEEYLEGFWGRLLPRLRAAIRQDEAVRAYLRGTFWRRWALRATATAAILALLFVVQSLRQDIRYLQGTVADLQQQIERLEAGT